MVVPESRLADIAKEYGLTVSKVSKKSGFNRSQMYSTFKSHESAFRLLCAGVRSSSIETDQDRLTEANRLIWQVIRGKS